MYIDGREGFAGVLLAMIAINLFALAFSFYEYRLAPHLLWFIALEFFLTVSLVLVRVRVRAGARVNMCIHAQHVPACMHACECVHACVRACRYKQRDSVGAARTDQGLTR